MMVKRKLKHFRAWLADNWKFSLLVIAVIGALALLLIFKLGSLVGGLSASESSIQQTIANNKLGPEYLLREAVFLPYAFLLYLVQLSPFHGPTAIRGIGALFGLLSVFGMFYIFRKWYTQRIAILGTILFATTSWFLYTARYADAAATYLLLPLLVAAVIALQAKARSRLAMAAAIIFGLSAVYIPGVILFLLPALIIKRKVIFRALRLQPLWYKLSLSGIAVIMLTPLVVTLAKPIPGQSTTSQNALELIGLPATLPSIGAILGNLRDSLGSIFVYSREGAISTPGHLPWFDICTTVLILIGIVQFVRYWRLDRSKLIAVTALVSLVLIALGGPVASVILLPFLFLFAVEGLKWLLEIWLEIFPKNPFARGFAVTMVCLLTFSVAFYQVNKYFFAWGKAPETRQVFNKHP